MAKKQTGERAVRLPKDITQAEVLLQALGEEKHAVDRLQARLNKEVDELNQKLDNIKKRYRDLSEPHQKKIGKLLEKLYMYATKNRDELTKKERQKTIKLLGGNFGWRKSQPTVMVHDSKKAIQELKDNRLKRFIRTKEEVDKTPIKADPESVSGLTYITIDTSEIFFVKPHEVKTEIAERTSRFKKVVE